MSNDRAYGDETSELIAINNFLNS